jgi:hypothetical protein
MTAREIIRAFVLLYAVPVISNRAGPPTARGAVRKSPSDSAHTSQVRA